MTTYSKILNLVSGVARTIDLSNTSNVLGVANLELLGSTSGHLLQTASATTTSYTIVWPDSQGAASTFLQNDGSGNLSWSPISSSPAISNTFVAGQSFSANTSYVVRWGMNALSETTNRVYAADYDTSSYDEFWALGIAMSTSGVTAGQNIQVYSFGTYTLGSSDTPFNTVNIGAPVWLTSAGAFSVTAPTGTSEADLKIGIIMSTTSIWLDGQVTGIGNANGGVPIYPLEVAAGGTGLNSLTPYAVICGGTGSTTAMQQVSGLGTSGYVLTSNGASALPTWQPGGTSLTFSDSLVNNSGTVTLVNDSASPGNSKYYGTNSSSVLGYYSLPVSGINQLTSDVTAGPGTGSQAATVAAIRGTTVSGTTGSGNVMFSVSPTTTGTLTAAAANFSGNVGIGGSPTSPLQVTYNSTGDTLRIVNTFGPGTAGIFAAGDANSAQFNIGSWNSGSPSITWSFGRGVGDGSSNFNLYNNVGSATVIAATTAGLVGIGNTSPSHTLDVTGTINASGNITGANLSGSNSGDVTLGTANGLSLSGQQLSLADFTSSTAGAAPASGGGTTNYLRADGTWDAPPGSSSYVFADSIVNTGGTVTLVNDSASPGASQYYGTNGSSVLGYFALPVFTSPLTTKGDTFVYSTTNTRQPVPGDYGQLIADSTQATGWRDATYTMTDGKPGKNYIQYADFENNSTTGWTLGTIGTLTNGLPTGSPTFGSGASGNLSIAATSSSIEGVYSLNYVSSAATTQGNMVASSSYAIDAEDQAKVLTVKFYYKAASGASNCNFSGTSSNSFAWAIYDVTNSSWLSSAGNFNLIQSSGCGYVTGTCQTNATTANIRLCVYNANATSGAATITLDGFYVGPQTAPSGPAVGDTSTSQYTFTPGATPFGSVTNNASETWRVGDRLHFNLHFTSGTTTANTAAIALPSGLSIDSTKMYASHQQTVGTGNVVAGTYSLWIAAIGIVVFFDGSDTGNIYISYEAASNDTLQKINANGIVSSGDGIQIRGSVPITGWSSNSVMSSDTDTRVVAFQATHSASVSFSTGNPIVLPVVTYDTHAGYNASTGLYTVQVTGYYNASVSGVAPNGAEYFALYKNTSNYGPYFEVDSSGDPRSGSIDVFCNAGDTLSFRPVSGSSTALAFSAGQLQTIFSISRKSGPAVVTATEVTGARYHASSTSISGSLAAITYSTKDFDTHAGYSGSTYTIPSSGAYQINASAQVSGTFALNTQTIIQIYRNGSAISGDQNYAGGVETDVFVNVSDIYPCVAGDTIQVYLSSGASSAAIVSSNIYNVFSISKTGRGA